MGAAALPPLLPSPETVGSSSTDVLVEFELALDGQRMIRTRVCVPAARHGVAFWAELWPTGPLHSTFRDVAAPHFLLRRSLNDEAQCECK